MGGKSVQLGWEQEVSVAAARGADSGLGRPEHSWVRKVQCCSGSCSKHRAQWQGCVGPAPVLEMTVGTQRKRLGAGLIIPRHPARCVPLCCVEVEFLSHSSDVYYLPGVVFVVGGTEGRCLGNSLGPGAGASGRNILGDEAGERPQR